VTKIVVGVAIIASSPLWIPLLLGLVDRLWEQWMEESRLLDFMFRLYDWARGY